VIAYQAMHPNDSDDANTGIAATDVREERSRNFRAALVGSAFLHGLILLVVILVVYGAAAPRDDTLVIPVNTVVLADKTTGPRQPDQAPVPQQKGGPPSAPATVSVDLSALKKHPPPDELEIKLRKLAKLQQPIMDMHLSKNDLSLSRRAAMSDDAASGPYATIKDFLRGQVERHWSPDLAMLGRNNISVRIRVHMTSAGVVTKAEVVDSPRVSVDKVYDEIAISARNAVLLASPFTLPPGRYAPLMDLVLSLDTRDALR
jgi:hypothetical protein